MIIWLASYPKSGNTLLRSILGTYFFSTDGFFDFKYTYLIPQFPKTEFFSKAGIDVLNDELILKNYIKAQETINSENKKIKFLKTHSKFFYSNGYHFTNWQNSLCGIYIVRDPRNVVKSYAHHSQLTIEETLEAMINIKQTLFKTKENCETILGSWNSNYNSWKTLGKKVLIVKYEDLVLKKKTTLLKIFRFLENFGFNILNLNMQKLNKSIKTTNFENMQKLEKKKTFKESMLDPKTGEKIPFFNLGIKNDWRLDLDDRIKMKIENAFRKEMEELGYL